MPDDDEFASVVFDEDFIRSAAVHEPSAIERMLAAAQAVAAADTVIEGGGSGPGPEWEEDSGADGNGLPSERRSYRGPGPWHRTIAWLLAVLMGIGVVALTFAAVYRGTGAGRQPAVPPPSTGPVGPQRLPPVVATRFP